MTRVYDDGVEIRTILLIQVVATIWKGSANSGWSIGLSTVVNVLYVRRCFST